MEYTKPQLANLAEILARGGVIPSSDWTSGRGRFTTKRALPPYCERLPAHTAQNTNYYGLSDDSAAGVLRGAVRVAFQQLMRRQPATRTVVAVTNLRAANRAVRQLSE